MNDSQLASLLEAELGCAREMLGLLDEEQAALKARDHATMERLVQTKLDRFRQWEEVERARVALTREAGYGEDTAALIAALPADSPLHVRWEALLELLGKCQQRNRSNGLHIELNRRHLEDALSILRGLPLAPAPTYEASGTTAQKTGAGRNLGTA
ncbi:flagellar protein FlgN [Thiohalobacter sp. IOR34]|uniref:flagella synthesis protein FlgN n=1 Tax=Thiohalobacter sp. IOR34 TaxID=3057176 RepID=UPI0025B036C5|nr:flagellar protein FlgN [Thiohalobacter sp. IOR34]WJW74619.1 flagellar protein FlgN [Thiohalobacter sp. IOR34]